MSSVDSFGLTVLLVALVGAAAVLSNRFTERLRIPAPAIFLLGAAAASDIWPGLYALSIPTVERVVTVALAVILFDGGLHIGRRRFRSAAGAIAWLGIAGTLVTAGAIAVLAHLAFAMDWRMSLLLGTALAPTDPAVVFSVLGRREIAGRSGTLLEGESGANDPVGVALLVSLLASAGTGVSAVGEVAVTFAEQMVIGAAVGIAGGTALLIFMRRVPLPSEGLYALRTLTGVLVLYGLATVAHGSGFLAVFAAGILIGDERAPYKREIERFHSSLASLGEIVAFVMLGITISLRDVAHAGVWVAGLVLAAATAFVFRPVLVGLLTWRIRLDRRERAFVLWTGLKGAVPILLGTYIVQAGLPDAHRGYEIIFVVVAFSVIVQGGFVPTLAHLLRIPLQVVEPEPWSLGVRFQEEPEGLHRFRVAAGSAADGLTVSDLPGCEDAWVSFIVRHGRFVPVRADSEVQADDEVFVLADPDTAPGLDTLFTKILPTE